MCFEYWCISIKNKYFHKRYDTVYIRKSLFFNDSDLKLVVNFVESISRIISRFSVRYDVNEKSTICYFVSTSTEKYTSNSKMLFIFTTNRRFIHRYEKRVLYSSERCFY